MEIVTGSTGAVHVTPIDDAVRNGNAGYVNDRVVFTYYENLEARAITANQVRVFSGYGMNQGRLFKIDRNDYDNVTIENGSQGVKRADLIVARYTMDMQTGFESITLEVIRGQSGDSYVDPSYTVGDINGGDTLDDFPLYRVKINGLVIEDVERLFDLLPDGGRIGEIEKRIDANLKTNLASETAGKLDGSEDVDIGVKGTLPINHGGTGQTTAAAAMKSLVIDNLGTEDNALTDSAEIITSPYNAGFTTTLKKRSLANLWTYIQDKVKTLLGMGSGTVVAVSKGGTGKASFTSGKALIGNGTGAISEWDIDTSPNSGHSNALVTSKGVADALGNAGYGDMMKSTYDTNNNGVVDKAEKLNTARTLKVNLGSTSNVTFDGSANQTGIGVSGTLPLGNGGTGSTDGTINGVKLAKSGTKYGYMDGSTFKSFRQPTGDAVAANVLSGKTFANSSSDSVTGTMANYSGSNRKTVTPTAGTGNQQLSLAAGYHDSVNVDRTSVYNGAHADGMAAAHAETWNVYYRMANNTSGTNALNYSLGSACQIFMEANNIVSISVVGLSRPSGSGNFVIAWSRGITIDDVYGNTTVALNDVYYPDANAKYVYLYYNYARGGAQQFTNVTDEVLFVITYQNNVLR